MDSSALAVVGLCGGYDKHQVLFDVSFHVEPGQVVAVLGNNGAGKTTLIRAISGLISPTAGTVQISGHDITGLRADDIARAGVAQVPGGEGVFGDLTVQENLELAVWKAPQSAPIATARDLFDDLGRLWEVPAGLLSGGQQQMLALAMAIVAQPQLLLIDEMSLGLAPSVVVDLVSVVRDIATRGVGIVIVEQAVHVALDVADDVVFLDKGTVTFRGTSSELENRPDIVESVFLQADSSRESPSVDSSGSSRRRSVTPSLLECEDLTVAFGGNVAVNNVSFCVAEREVVGIVGANGAGKTTLFNLISGAQRADAGVVRIDGQDMSSWPMYRRSECGLGRSFQDAQLFASMTVRETLAVACERFVPSRSILAAGLMLPHHYDSELRVAARVEELLDLMKLRSVEEMYLSELSTGTRRVVEIACQLAHRPRVLLLDEPSSGIAHRDTQHLVPLLQDIMQETESAVVVIEHDVQLLSQLASRFLAMDRGRLICDGEPSEVMRHPDVVSSYLGGER